MFAEQVFAKVILKIAPDRVDMVGVVLGVVVFEEERRGLKAIIMRLPFFNAPSPAKIDFLQAGFLDLLNIFAREIRTQALDVNSDQPHQRVTLSFRKVRSANANLLEWFYFSFGFGDDLLGGRIGEDGF